MTGIVLALLAVLSIWDYPARQPEHDRLRQQFLTAFREGDTETMAETCRKGIELLPDDPTWHYNLACSLAYFKKKTPALDELEKAIDLGFRDPEAIAKDSDLARLAQEARFRELVKYAEEMRAKPILTGPMAVVPATGVFGRQISLGEQNLLWDFDLGCFDAKLQLVEASAGGNTGDLYMNRDARHANLTVTNYPGLTPLVLDAVGRERGMDLNVPNLLLPYPAFGNCSMAFTQGPFWRSIPRALMTLQADRLKAMQRFYLSNQIWVFPSNADTAPVGTNGDVFASITPYWLTTAGRSWSDLPYLDAALKASAAFQTPVKREIVRRGLLAPTIQTLIRKSLKGVRNEKDYLSEKAHPTALPPNGVELHRLVASAAALTDREIPPLAVLAVKAEPVKDPGPWPELTYATGFAWAFVLRAEQDVRTFLIQARGAQEYAFVQTHGRGVKVTIERLAPDVAKVTVDRRGLSPVNRVDIAVFGRNSGTGWGAPSYVCFARMDPKAAYSDPALTLLSEPPAK